MPTATALESVEDVVRRRGGELVELSHAIHAEPELAFAEHAAAPRLRRWWDAVSRSPRAPVV
jgi:metal-dependent amidase/aminoacylase/carboxypeptidase family protein